MRGPAQQGCDKFRHLVHDPSGSLAGGINGGPVQERGLDGGWLAVPGPGVGQQVHLHRQVDLLEKRHFLQVAAREIRLLVGIGADFDVGQSR